MLELNLMNGAVGDKARKPIEVRREEFYPSLARLIGIASGRDLTPRQLQVLTYVMEHRENIMGDELSRTLTDLDISHNNLSMQCRKLDRQGYLLYAGQREVALHPNIERLLTAVDHTPVSFIFPYDTRR